MTWIDYKKTFSKPRGKPCASVLLAQIKKVSRAIKEVSRAKMRSGYSDVVASKKALLEAIARLQNGLELCDCCRCSYVSIDIDDTVLRAENSSTSYDDVLQCAISVSVVSEYFYVDESLLD